MARLKFYLAAAWWGSLTTIGFVVVPLLFKYLDTPATAGQMAGHLFTAQAWMSVVCCVLLLLATQRENRDAAETPSIWLISGLLLALLLEVGVKPHIMARDNLMLWHNLGSLFYVAQWACALKYFWHLIPGADAKTMDATGDQAP